MVAWSGIGMNYGHQSSYDSSVVESDLTFLASIGITRVRIAFTGYASSLTNTQDMAQRALNHGFYVVWGVTSGVSNGLTATTWAALKTFVSGTGAPWAQSVGLSELALSNEEELHVDGTTLTAATVRSDIRALATTVKSGGFTGKVSYNTSISSTYFSPWVSEGKGSLDLLGWNSYDVLSNFQNRNANIVSNFGSAGYVSEFGCITNGYADYNDESSWYTDVVNRVSNLKSAGVSSGYFFCYRDGGFGLTANTFALVLSNSSVRSARDAIKNITTPSYSSFMVHQ